MSVLKVYNPIDIEVDHGDGVYLYAIDGTRFLDFTSGIGVNCLGHSHPSLVNALKSQGEKIWHCSNLFKVVGQETVADKLVKNSFASDVFFCNSGSEATETSIKVARKFFYEKGYTSKNRIITFEGAFHGRTLASLFAAKNPDHTRGFGPDVEGFDQVPFGDHEALEKAINKDTAAIMVETIMGEGGIRVIPEDCLKGLRKLCDERDILLILDEVQCGLGRTGKFFAFEWAKIKPDIVPIAKGIGGGFPIGAVLMSKKVAKPMIPGTHGSTFGGNPLAMTIGNKVVDEITKKGFLSKVRKLSTYFMKNLNKLKNKYPNIISEIRGKGFLIGIKLKVNQQHFIENLFRQQLLTIKASENVVRILPPLNVKKSEINKALKIIDNVCLKYNLK